MIYELPNGDVVSVYGWLGRYFPPDDPPEPDPLWDRKWDGNLPWNEPKLGLAPPNPEGICTN